MFEKILNWKIRWLVAGWLLVSVVILVLIHELGDGKELWPLKLATLNNVIALVLAPIAALSAGLSFVQWKVQRDRELGYEDPQVSDSEIGSAIGSFGDEAAEPVEEAKETEIVEAETDKYDTASRIPDASDRLLTIFRTSKQETVLQVKGGGVACYIHDIRPGRGGEQWSLNRTQVERILTDAEHSITTKPYKPRTGLLTIGPRKNWLYSISLFQGPEDIKAQVRRLLERSRSH